MNRIIKITLFILATALFVSVLFATVSAKTTFSDVKPGAYYEESVSWAVDNLITNGTSSDKFSPDMNCTRGHIVTFLYRALGEPAVIDGENPFTDVDEYDYFYNAVLWAVKNGINAKIIGFLSARNDMLIKREIETDEVAYTTPRSWEKVSDILNYVDENIDSVYPLISGTKGKLRAAKTTIASSTSIMIGNMT